jgi:hypothetical protein
MNPASCMLASRERDQVLVRLGNKCGRLLLTYKCTRAQRNDNRLSFDSHERHMHIRDQKSCTVTSSSTVEDRGASDREKGVLASSRDLQVELYPIIRPAWMSEA